MRTTPDGVVNTAATTPGWPFGATHSTSRSSSTRFILPPSHSSTRAWSPAISSLVRAMSPPPADGCCSGSLSHWTKKGSCGSLCRPLTPTWRQRSWRAVGGEAAALDRGAAEALLDGGEVVDGHDPAEPAAAVRGTGPDGLAEGRLVGGGVVEHLDDLEVATAGEREDPVAGAEAWVEAAVDEAAAQLPAEPPGRLVETLGSRGEGQVIQLHRPSVSLPRCRRPEPGPRGGPGAGPVGTRTPRTARPAPRTPRRPSARAARRRWWRRPARPRRGPRCSRSSTSRGRARPVPSPRGRTRRCSPRGRWCRRCASPSGTGGAAAAASTRRAWSR